MPSSVPPKVPLKVSIATLGCKLNQFESEAILTQFRAAGYDITGDVSQADVCVVNTCSVTATAESKARALLRSTRRRNPGARLLAVGCMSERTPEALAGLGGVDAILGNSEKEHILDFLPKQRATESAEVFLGETSAATKFGDSLRVEGLLGRTRSFLKVQDGCSQKCTYCIVPKLRGTGRSLPIEKAVERAERLAEIGFAEIVLTGVALGTYGFDLDLVDGLAKLLAELEKIPGLKRIRLGSVEPWAVTDRFLRVMADSAIICPHLHIPLQSADDFVLHRMNRRYLVKDIQRIFDTAFSLRQDWGFGSDIILGFPGETQEYFENTRRFLADSPLSYLHIFPYSARPGTPSTKLPDPVPETEKKERVADLRDLDSRLRLRFRKRNLNTRQSVLFEKRFVGNLLAGHTANYLDVYVDASDALAGQLRDTIITRLHPDGVEGELAS
jgi:threonylcarbamoyladenosine tRNA methylthiotransferase MtaB